MIPFVQVAKYPDGTISYWAVEISEEDNEKIYEILEKYISDGFSCRGGIKPILKELGEVMEEAEGWA